MEVPLVKTQVPGDTDRFAGSRGTVEVITG